METRKNNEFEGLGLEAILFLTRKKSPDSILLEGYDTLPIIERPRKGAKKNTPQERGKVLFRSVDGRFACGIWESEAGVIPIPHYPVNEFCALLSGEVVLEDSNGDLRIFRPGDYFLVPTGFKGNWVMPTRSRKVFVCSGEPEMLDLLFGQSA